jgi:tryptophanyl-tRNA synthetase
MTGDAHLAPAAAASLFSEAYYRRVVEEFGYSTFDFRRFDFEFAGMSQEQLNARFLCHHAADAFASAERHDRVVTTGFGMSGPPHMATASHVMKMVELQRAGERCQIVLGDLDAYNGRSRSYGYTRDLGQQFASFVVRLGFDVGRGVLRDQAGSPDVLMTMYLSGRYTEEDDFARVEEDTHAHYVALGLVDASMTFRRRLALTLMASDFVALGQAHSAVLVMLGLDEHRYVRFAHDLVRRFDGASPLGGDFLLASMYTRLNVGFAGHPKFSKSISGSAISVDSSADEIRQLVGSDEGRDPARSPVFQLMCQMPGWSTDLDALQAACMQGGRAWTSRTAPFADYLVHVADAWNR